MASDSFIKTKQLRNNKFLDVNKLPEIYQNINDEEYTIGHGYDERPDLLAHQIYGSSRLWWVFAMRNPDIIKDPIKDFKAGKTIILPAEDTVKKLRS